MGWKTINKKTRKQLFHRIFSGPAIRSANQGDSRTSIRATWLAAKLRAYFHNVRMLRTNRLKPIFSALRRDSQERGLEGRKAPTKSLFEQEAPKIGTQKC